MAQESLIKIYDTPKGPHVYVGDFRLHHWIPGLVAAVIGGLGLLFDKNKKRKGFYFLLCLAGSVAFIDDLDDFMSFLEDGSLP